jgi:hypothetical protein
MEFVILAGAVIVGFLAGWIGRERHAMNRVMAMIEEAEADVDEETKPDRLKLERQGEMIYAYTTDDEFIGQGKTLVELDDAIQKRFPGRKFLIKQSNIEEVGVGNELI